MAKATVQAALGPVMLKRITDDSSDEEKHYADIILMVCILSIVVTAPIGAILISITGPRLLTKTKQAPPTEGKRKYLQKNDAIETNLIDKFKVGDARIVHRCMISVS